MTVRVPKYRLHKGSGQALVEIAGRRIYLGRHNSDESRERYRRLIAELMSPQQVVRVETPRVSLRINQLILRYYRFAKSYYVKNGVVTDEVAGVRAALRRLRNHFGTTPAEEFGPRAFKTIRESMIQEGLSRKYINDSMARIRRMFRWGAAEELVPASAFQSLMSVPGLRRGRCGAKEGRLISSVPDEVVEATLRFLPEVVADMVRLQRLAGMRPAEVCIMRPCDVDRTGDVWVYRPATHKTEHAGKERAVPLGPKAQEVLLRYLVRDPQTFCFRPCDSEVKRRAERHAARVTPASHGNRPGTNRVPRAARTPGDRYVTASYRRAIQRACDKAFPHPSFAKVAPGELLDVQKTEIRDWQVAHLWSPNQLRHSAATDIRRQFGLEAAQVVLGHSGADVTQIYAERDLARGLEVARMIG